MFQKLNIWNSKNKGYSLSCPQRHYIAPAWLWAQGMPVGDVPRDWVNPGPFVLLLLLT